MWVRASKGVLASGDITGRLARFEPFGRGASPALVKSRTLRCVVVLLSITESALFTKLNINTVSRTQGPFRAIFKDLTAMPRRHDDYDVVYVSRPREIVYEYPRRSAAAREYDLRSYVPGRYLETPIRIRDGPSRNMVVVSELAEGYGPDAYYQPSRTSRDFYQATRPTIEDRHGGRFAAEEYSQRRRWSPDNHTRRRPESPDGYHNARGERGRMEDRRSSPSRRLRSAMRGSRHQSPEERRRARARSVSFRDREVSKHDVGNQKHERPGYEARTMGQYLRHDEDDDLASETYAIRRKAKRYL